MSKQWIDKGGARPKKALHCTTKKTTMLICFFDFEGILHHEFVPQKQRVKSEYNAQVLARLREKIWKKRPTLWKDNSYFILHNNAPIHTAHHTVTCMMETEMNDLPHPAYSPDLALCDFWLFPMMKKQLKGREFKRILDLQAAIVSILDQIQKDDFEVAFHRLLTRWRKCVASAGAYFEGDGIIPADEDEFTDSDIDSDN